MADLPPDVLQSHSKLFALLDEPGRKRLSSVASEVRYAPGHAVVSEGDFGDSFFLVLEGELSVRIGGVDATREVARLGPSSFFGEIAALLGEARSATVLALTATRALRFDAPRVQGILKDYPVVREVLVKLGLKRAEDNLQQLMEDDFPGVPVTATGEGLPFSSDASRAPGSTKDE